MGALRLLRFALPSILGVFFFLCPVRYQGSWTIPMSVLSDVLENRLGDSLPYIGFALVLISALLSVYYSLVRQENCRHSRLEQLFTVTPLWLALRVIGAIFGGMIIWQVGPELVWSETTGHIVVYDLLTAIVTIFLFAAFLLPLLTDFGLMELVGIALSPVFRRLFRLPGRSCVDAIASWMTAATVGVLITSQQYEKGFYSQREAATIATNFSVVSLPFCVVIAEFVQLGHVFVPFYLTVCCAGLITAIVMPRIPPLSKIPDQYSEAGKQRSERDRLSGEEPAGSLTRGFLAALERADHAPRPRAYLQSGMYNLFDIWFGLMPPLIAIATFGLIVAEYTPVFEVLSYPLGALLSWLQIPDAGAAAPALLVGFVEMFLPGVIAQGIESELTRFVIISVAITQLIYMSEVGVLILKTRIPLNFINLVTLFVLRTIIALPVIVAIAQGLVAAGVLA